MTRAALHKANGSVTYLSLFQNTVGDVGAIALAGALKATCAMCFPSGAKSMFFWPSLAQAPEFNHLSTVEQTRTLMWKGVDVLLCLHRVWCGVRCVCSPLHRARAKKTHARFLHGRSARCSCAHLRSRDEVRSQSVLNDEFRTWRSLSTLACLTMNSGNMSQMRGQDLTR